MKQTIFRQISDVRRTSRPRSGKRKPAGGFDSLLARLTGASNQLARARKRR